MNEVLKRAAGYLLALIVAAAPGTGAAAGGAAGTGAAARGAPVPGTAAERVPNAAPGSIPDAAERAELQRLLTQRIAKAYCQGGLGVAPAGSGQELLESVALFDLQVAKLGQSPLSGPEQSSLAAVEQHWKPLRSTALGRLTREGCETASRQSEELMRAATGLARQIRERTGAVDAGTLAAMSERQRLLAEKLAQLYMARGWGLDSVALREEIASARNEFSGALAKLQEAPENTAAVNEWLKKVALQWVWIDTALEQGDYSSYGLVVADSTDIISRDMEAVTRLYRGSRDAPQPIVGWERYRDLPGGQITASGIRRGDALASLKD